MNPNAELLCCMYCMLLSMINRHTELSYESAHNVHLMGTSALTATVPRLVASSGACVASSDLYKWTAKTVFLRGLREG